MRRNESTELSPFAINPQMFGGKLRACTNSIFCAGASAEAKHHIAHKANISVAEVEKQALPLAKPTDVQILSLENYNLQGTGHAYRALIHDGTLEVVNGHADTVKPF